MKLDKLLQEFFTEGFCIENIITGDAFVFKNLKQATTIIKNELMKKDCDLICNNREIIRIYNNLVTGF